MFGDDDPVVSERRKICKSCEHNVTMFYVKICNLCNCPISSKTYVKSSECPIKKWEKVE